MERILPPEFALNTEYKALLQTKADEYFKRIEGLQQRIKMITENALKEELN